MAELHCAQLRELAPELALGVLAGRERALAIAHLQDCSACEQHVRELSVVGDRLLALVPGAEPPVGFEERVLTRLGLTHRRRWRRWLGAAAAVVAAAAIATAGWLLHSDPHDHDFASATLTAGTGTQIGEVFAYSDHRPWLYVDLSSSMANGTVACQIQLADGRILTVGYFPVSSGSAQWSGPAPLDGSHLQEVRILTEDGRLIGTAHFS